MIISIFDSENHFQNCLTYAFDISLTSKVYVLSTIYKECLLKIEYGIE
jgi:hypothetical protein